MNKPKEFIKKWNNIYNYISAIDRNWVEWLPMAKFAYNNRQHLSTGKSPFLVDLGRHPNISEEGRGSSERVPEAGKFI